MSTIVVFHSALGRRPAVHRFAERLRAHGHDVHVPDLFDGKVFDRLEDGVAERDAVGIPGLMGRAASAMADMPDKVVVVGFSMGAGSAQWLAATRPGVQGCVLVGGVLPIEALGVGRWPSVPTEVHYAQGDPWVDEAVVRDFAASAPDRIAVTTYSAGGHLFADEDCEDFDADSAARLAQKVRDFVGSLPDEITEGARC